MSAAIAAIPTPADGSSTEPKVVQAEAALLRGERAVVIDRDHMSRAGPGMSSSASGTGTPLPDPSATVVHGSARDRAAGGHDSRIGGRRFATTPMISVAGEAWPSQRAIR